MVQEPPCLNRTVDRFTYHTFAILTRKIHVAGYQFIKNRSQRPHVRAFVRDFTF